jgi:hypothetical protein
LVAAAAATGISRWLLEIWSLPSAALAVQTAKMGRCSVSCKHANRTCIALAAAAVVAKLHLHHTSAIPRAAATAV